MSEKWGVGDRARSKSFDTVRVGGEEVELIHGEHPHSRRDDTTYARFPDGRIEGFDGHRPLIGFRYEPVNYLKSSGLSGNQVRKGGAVVISFNGNDTYSRFCREPERAAALVLELLPKLTEHSVPLWWEGENYKAMINRKIYYKGTPCVVTDWDRAVGEITVKTIDGKPFPLESWQGKSDILYDESDYERLDILDERIWWHRD